MNNLITELVDRTLELEFQLPTIIYTDFTIFDKLKIPKEVELTDNLGNITFNGRQLVASPIAFLNNDDESISKYLQQQIDKGCKVWIKRIYTHFVGNKYTIVELISGC